MRAAIVWLGPWLVVLCGCPRAAPPGGTDSGAARTKRAAAREADRSGESCRSHGTFDAMRLELCERECDGGDLTACARAASQHELGIGVAFDLGRALLLYRRACAGGVARSCFRLGRLYESGAKGVARDLDRARRLMKKACDSGDRFACEHLARDRAPAAPPPRTGSRADSGG